jgi:hypothetical protein
VDSIPFWSSESSGPAGIRDNDSTDFFGLMRAAFTQLPLVEIHPSITAIVMPKMPGLYFHKPVFFHPFRPLVWLKSKANA